MTQTVKQIEAAILAGDEIDPQVLIQAQQQEAAAEKIAELKHTRAELLKQEAYRTERLEHFEQLRKDFHALVEEEDSTVKTLWHQMANAIRAYAKAAEKRNAELLRISQQFWTEKRTPTQIGKNVLKIPFQNFASDNGASVENISLDVLNVVHSVEKCVGLSLGETLPNYPGFLGHGGHEKAKEAGIHYGH